MKISAKTEYACIAMMELASQFGTGEPVRIRRIAERHDVPPRFLVQILLQLKGAGLVASIRGAAGGGQLVKTPTKNFARTNHGCHRWFDGRKRARQQCLARFSGR